MKRNIQGAIFDMDGTVLDSMPYWRDHRVQFLKKRGLDAPEGLVDRMQSMTIREAVACMKTTFSLPESEEEILSDMLSVVRAFYESGLPTKPGLIPFLEELKRRGVPTCIASATDADLVEMALQKSGVRHYFDAVFSTKTIGRSKKYPDIFLLAQKHMGSPTGATWVFEDALYALRTAGAAGFLTVGVYDDDEAYPEKIRENCDVYFPDFSVYDRYF